MGTRYGPRAQPPPWCAPPQSWCGGELRTSQMRPHSAAPRTPHSKSYHKFQAPQTGPAGGIKATETPGLTEVCSRQRLTTEYSQPCPSACWPMPTPSPPATQQTTALKRSRPPLEGDTAQRLQPLPGTNFHKTKLQAGADTR